MVVRSSDTVYVHTMTRPVRRRPPRSSATMSSRVDAMGCGGRRYAATAKLRSRAVGVNGRDRALLKSVPRHPVIQSVPEIFASSTCVYCNLLQRWDMREVKASYQRWTRLSVIKKNTAIKLRNFVNLTLSSFVCLLC